MSDQGNERWFCWYGIRPPLSVEAPNNQAAAEKYARAQSVTAGKTIIVVRAKDATTFTVGVR